MSIRLMTKVWDSDRYSGAALLVLLCLADFANDEGERIYPGIDRLARKARLSPRAVQRILRDLIDDGILEPIENHGGGRGKMTVYRMNVERVQKCHPLEAQKGAGLSPFTGGEDPERVQDCHPLPSVKGDNGDTKGCISKHERVTLETERVTIATAHIDEPPRTVIEPPREPPIRTASLRSPSDVERAVMIFNEAAADCPKMTPCQSVTDARRKLIAARLAESGLAGWSRAVGLAAGSGFLGGPMPTAGEHRNWRFDIGWFAKLANFTKILEGGYAPASVSRSAGLQSAFEGLAEFMNGNGRGR